MKKMLNSLYVTRQESYVHKERETIIVRCGDEKLGQFPALAISNILCFGRVSVSPFLLGYCAEKGIGLAYFTEHGRFLATMQGKSNGNVLLRRQQYRWADDPAKTAELVRLIVGAKIANCRAVLMRELRNHGDNSGLKQAAARLRISLRRVRDSNSTDAIRGIEGEAASVYFSVFGNLIRQQGFEFGGRVRRPPTDPINALLSFVYSLITNECGSSLAGAGLDSFVGFLHRDRPGRQSLALDLIEELRAPWADRLVLTLVNRRQIRDRDFQREASGAIRLKDGARKQLIVNFQERKRAEITHPYLKEKIPLARVYRLFCKNSDPSWPYVTISV